MFLQQADVFLLTCLWRHVVVNTPYDCRDAGCVSLTASGGPRRLQRHCGDSVGSSVPFVSARSRFPPTVGRRAARFTPSLAFAGWLGWKGWKAHSHSWSHYKRTAVLLHSELSLSWQQDKTQILLILVCLKQYIFNTSVESIIHCKSCTERSPDSTCRWSVMFPHNLEIT